MRKVGWWVASMLLSICYAGWIALMGALAGWVLVPGLLVGVVLFVLLVLVMQVAVDLTFR